MHDVLSYPIPTTRVPQASGRASERFQYPGCPYDHGSRLRPGDWKMSIGIWARPSPSWAFNYESRSRPAFSRSRLIPNALEDYIECDGPMESDTRGPSGWPLSRTRSTSVPLRPSRSSNPSFFHRLRDQRQSGSAGWSSGLPTAGAADHVRRHASRLVHSQRRCPPLTSNCAPRVGPGRSPPAPGPPVGSATQDSSRFRRWPFYESET